MKRFLSIVFLLSISILKNYAQTTQRFITLQNNYNNADLVIEGNFTKTNPSFYNAKGEIQTSFEVTVIQEIKNTASNSAITLHFDGGTIVDPKTGLVTETKDLHNPNGPPLGKTLYFIKKDLDGNFRTFQMIPFENPSSIISNPTLYSSQPYTSLTEFYSDLSAISGKTLQVQKKSAGINEAKESSLTNISYEKQVLNYNSLLSYKAAKVTKSANLSAKPMATDLNLGIVNGIITGSGTKYFEFDVLVSSNTSSFYFDNTAVHISYNTAVFGTNVVAGNNVLVTNGAAFNNSNYIIANNYKNDISSNVFAFAIGTDPILPTPTRVNISPSAQQLAHVRIKLANCGANTNLALTNASLAINVSFYSTTQNANTFLSYDNLTYNPANLTTLFSCGPGINDFSAPVVGGLNNALTIYGYNFGNTRGNGQVKFRNADVFGFPYNNKLDNMDYLLWNDSTIQVRMPSQVDTVNPNSFNTPGTGRFKVITNTGDSAIAPLANQFNIPFGVYYSIYNTRPTIASGFSIGQKLKANLYNSVVSSGGYIIRCDSSVGNHPQMKMCVRKAVKDWNCLTATNLKIGTDTIMSVTASDKICNIYVVPSAQMTSPTSIAETRVNSLICPTGPVRAINDFDIKINSNYLSNFYYDTLLNNLPAINYDFLEIMYHEIGHGIGLMHVIDSSAVMYYRTLGGQPTVIPGGSRRRLIPFTSDVDGGDNQVSTSGTNLTLQCGFQDMIQLTSGSCAIIGVEELLKANFNALIYPNPSSDLIHISFEAPYNSKSKIEVYNILGEKVYDKVFENNLSKQHLDKISLSAFSSGVYLLNIIVDNNKSSFKIVKQ